MTDKTAFQKIAFFNSLIGNTNSADLSGLDAQFHCIKEEFQELEAALIGMKRVALTLSIDDPKRESSHAYFFQELRDGIADVLVTVYGLAHRAGIDADADLEAVNVSNMSKFIKGDGQAAREEAVATAMRIGIEARFDETANGIWAITSLFDQTGSDGKFYPKGKLLKPSTYKEPVFPDSQGNVEKAAQFEPCLLAPFGWACTRVKDHDGPCAAVAIEIQSGLITQRQLEFALNSLSIDNAANTPDFELAKKLFERAAEYHPMYDLPFDEQTE